MPIASALFSESQSRLFQWLFGQPDREFHLNELRRLTGLGSASLQRELQRLSSAGLVSSRRIGNMRCFQANAESPVFDELVALTRKTLTVDPMLREALLPLAPRLRAAWIFGSLAKGTDTASSDIDVMLISENLSLGEILERLLPLEKDLGRKINPTCYSQNEFRRRAAEPDSFVQRVVTQPVIPLIGDPHEFADTR